MEFKKNIENLSKDIQDIGKLVENLKYNSGISRIESDILKKKIQNLYESFLQIERFVTEGFKESVQETLSENVSEVKTYSETAKTEESETFVGKDTENEVIETGETNAEPDTDSKIHHVEDSKLSGPPHGIHKPHLEVVSDMYQNKQHYMNEALQQNSSQKDLSSKFHDQPIPDIASAIGINEKFRYIRELFNGDSDRYSETIKTLNSINSEKEAIDYLNKNFSWDMEGKLVKRLLDLTRRKLKMKVDE